MDFFYIAILVFYLIYATAKIITDRYANPNYILLLVLSYYTLPLVFTSYFTDGAELLSVDAKDTLLISQSIMILFWSTSSVIFGNIIGCSKRLKINSIYYIFKLNKSCCIFTIVLLYIIVTGLLLFGVETFFSGYNFALGTADETTGTALIFFSLQFLGIILLFSYLNYVQTRSMSSFINCFLLISVILFIGLLRGKRLEPIIALSPLILFLWSERRFLRPPLIRVALVLLVSVILGVVAMTRMDAVPTLEGVAFNIFTEGIYAGHSLPGTLALLNNNLIDYEYGLRYIFSILAIVPRFIWDSKDVVN